MIVLLITTVLMKHVWLYRSEFAHAWKNDKGRRADIASRRNKKTTRNKETGSSQKQKHHQEKRQKRVIQ